MNNHIPETRQVTDSAGNWRKTWCGPYAVATICKTDYETPYQIIRKLRKKRHAKGVSMENMVAACHKLGFRGNYVKLKKRRKMQYFCKEGLQKNQLYIVEVQKHVVVLDTKNWKLIDNQTTEWIEPEKSRYWGKQAKGYISFNVPSFK